MSVVRISLLRQKLSEIQNTLVLAIKALKGNLAFYAGIDRENGAMTNVSVWETLTDAHQLDSLRAMLDLAQSFVEAGVRFERPITNHETIWVL